MLATKYELPILPYDLTALEPHMSSGQLAVHHQKHHQAYVAGANQLLAEFNQSLEQEEAMDMRAWSKSFAFQIGGFVLHNLFWQNLRADNKGQEPGPALKKSLEHSFDTVEKFKALFSEQALSTEAAGWSALVQDRQSKSLLLMQIEKHNVNIFPEFKIILLLDMFEHAYYIDYQSNKKAYVENFWHLVDWEEVAKRSE